MIAAFKIFPLHLCIFASLHLCIFASARAVLTSLILENQGVILSKFFAALLFLLSAMAGRAQAITPENGWWWNPNASGSGYNIEVQDNVLAMSAYVFEPSGAPVYYISAGLMSSDRTYSGSLDLVSGGQCIGCAYKPPTTASIGHIAVQFDSASTGTLSINGGAAIPIQRLAYSLNMTSPYAMLGEWALIRGSASFPVYSGERIQLGATYRSTSDGALYASGNRSGSTPDVALTRQDTNGRWYMILDSSTSYYQYFEFGFSGLNAIEGRSWTILKTSTVSGSGTPFIGFRSLSASAVKSGVRASGTTETAKHHVVSSAVDAALRDELLSMTPENARSDVGQPLTDDALIALETMRRLMLQVKQK